MFASYTRRSAVLCCDWLAGESWRLGSALLTRARDGAFDWRARAMITSRYRREVQFMRDRPARVLGTDFQCPRASADGSHVVRRRRQPVGHSHVVRERVI